MHHVKYSSHHHRQSIRLQGYDYSQEGCYFVTLGTKNRECLFGEVVDGEMQINDAGQIIEDTWNALGDRFPTIRLGDFVIMPDHFYGIIFLTSSTQVRDKAGAASSAPTLGGIIRVFKSISGIAINRLLGRQGQSLWQRNYFEHIVRDDNALARIQEYISGNPGRWETDPEHPLVKEFQEPYRWFQSRIHAVQTPYI